MRRKFPLLKVNIFNSAGIDIDIYGQKFTVVNHKAVNGQQYSDKEIIDGLGFALITLGQMVRNLASSKNLIASTYKTYDGIQHICITFDPNGKVIIPRTNYRG